MAETKRTRPSKTDRAMKLLQQAIDVMADIPMGTPHIDKWSIGRDQLIDTQQLLQAIGESEELEEAPPEATALDDDDQLPF